VDAGPGTAGRVVVPVTSRRVYLAARYSRREEMIDVARQLRDRGHEVTSRWIEGNHLITEEQLVNDRTLGIRLASEDCDDLERADLVISFTEPPRSAPNRGGRHVEYGLALGLGTECWVVGPRENVFHVLADRVFATWGEALGAL